MNSKNHVSHGALSLLSLIAVVFILFILKPFIIPIIFAIIFSVIVFPIQRFLEKKWRYNRLLATLWHNNPLAFFNHFGCVFNKHSVNTFYG